MNYEGTHIRNQAVMLRHRQYGESLTMSDIDSIEHIAGTPVGTIEYKYMSKFLTIMEDIEAGRAMEPGVGSQLMLIKNIADKFSCGAYLVGYEDGLSFWSVMPLNPAAKKVLNWVAEPRTVGEDVWYITEEQWVRVLYHMRGWVVPASVLSEIKSKSWVSTLIKKEGVK